MGQTNKWPHHAQDSIINNQLQKTSASRFLTRILMYPHECFWFLSCGFKKMTKFQSCSELSLPTKSLSGSANRQISLRKQQAIIVACSSSFVFSHFVALQNGTQQRRWSYSREFQFMQSRILEIMQNLDCVGNCLKTKKCKLPNL
jgi:hypothetical protein